MALKEMVQEILGERGFEIRKNRLFLNFSNGWEIKLKETLVGNNFFDLFSELCGVFGHPVWVHSYYGFVWEQGGDFLSLNNIEEVYNSDITCLFVFKKMPIGKRVSYEIYAQIEEIAEQVFSENNLKNVPYFVHYGSGKFTFSGNNSEKRCVLTIKKNLLEFYSYQKGVQYRTHRSFQKTIGSMKDPSTIKQALERCFHAD